MALHPLIQMALAKKSIVEDSWKGFAKIIQQFDKEPWSKTQHDEMRKAYYAGFYSAFDLMMQVSTEVPEERAAIILENIKDYCEAEIKKFADWESFKKDKTN